MKYAAIASAALAAVFCGCATTVARETQLDRKAMSAALEPQDVRRTVEKMVDSMLLDQQFIAELGGERPVLDVSGLKNRSSMHIDMASITDSIRTKLIRSRKFRFVDRATADEDSGFGVDQPTEQTAPQMYLYGALSEMRQQVNGVTDRYYKFTLNLKDLRTGELVWSDEQEIRKQEEKSTFGL